MNRDEILLRTGLSPLKAAEVLADVLSATLRVDDGRPMVYRSVSRDAGGEGTVGGPVSGNYLRDDTAEPDEQSIYDFGYDTLFDIWMTRRSASPDLHEQVQRAEAGRMFTELTKRLPYPVVHASEGGLIHAAWTPELGRTDFPPGTSADAEHRDRWGRYALTD